MDKNLKIVTGRCASMVGLTDFQDVKIYLDVHNNNRASTLPTSFQLAKMNGVPHHRFERTMEE